MFRGDRAQNASFRRGLIIVFTATTIVAPFAGHTKEKGKHHGAHKLLSEHYRPAFSTFGAIGLPIVLPEEPSIRESKEKQPNWGDPNCAYPSSHDEADLCEQWKMSKTSVEALKQSALQTFLGIIGFAAIMFTLGATYATTRASIKAAKAADDAVTAANAAVERATEANDISRSTSERQLRAYLCLKSVENTAAIDVLVQNMVIAYIFCAKICNAGQTPATNIIATTYITDILENLEPIFIHKNSIIPVFHKTIEPTIAVFTSNVCVNVEALISVRDRKSECFCFSKLCTMTFSARSMKT